MFEKMISFKILNFVTIRRADVTLTHCNWYVIACSDRGIPLLENNHGGATESQNDRAGIVTRLKMQFSAFGCKEYVIYGPFLKNSRKIIQLTAFLTATNDGMRGRGLSP